MSPIPGHHLSEPAWRRVKGGAWILLTLVFVALLIRAENKSDEAIDRVTRVESPCLKYGAESNQCREAFEEAVQTITHAQACAILRKAGLEIQECKGARLRQERQDRLRRNVPKYGEPSSALRGSADGKRDVTAVADVGGSNDSDRQPGKDGSDSPPAPGSGGSGEGESPPAAAPPADPASPAPEPTRPGLIDAITGPASEVVEQAGKDAEETVDKATCNQVVSLCP